LTGSRSFVKLIATQGCVDDGVFVLEDAFLFTGTYSGTKMSSPEELRGGSLIKFK
jgi:hypothetical protein